MRFVEGQNYSSRIVWSLFLSDPFFFLHFFLPNSLSIYLQATQVDLLSSERAATSTYFSPLFPTELRTAMGPRPAFIPPWATNSNGSNPLFAPVVPETHRFAGLHRQPHRHRHRHLHLHLHRHLHRQLHQHRDRLRFLLGQLGQLGQSGQSGQLRQKQKTTLAT